MVERDGNGKKKVSNKKKDGNGGERKEKMAESGKKIMV